MKKNGKFGNGFHPTFDRAGNIFKYIVLSNFFVVYKLLSSLYQRPIWQYVATGPSNALMPNRRQVITLSNLNPDILHHCVKQRRNIAVSGDVGKQMHVHHEYSHHPWEINVYIKIQSAQSRVERIWKVWRPLPFQFQMASYSGVEHQYKFISLYRQIYFIQVKPK